MPEQVATNAASRHREFSNDTIECPIHLQGARPPRQNKTTPESGLVPEEDSDPPYSHLLYLHIINSDFQHTR